MLTALWFFPPQRDKLCCGSGNCHRELSCRRGEQWRAVSGGIVQRFNSPLRRLELNVYKWRRTRGARQLLHAGIIMAISKLKSRDIIRDNSIYYDPSINVQPQSMRWNALAVFTTAAAAAAAAGFIKS